MVLAAGSACAVEVAVGNWVVDTTGGRINVSYDDFEVIRRDRAAFRLGSNMPECRLEQPDAAATETVARIGDGQTITTTRNAEKAGVKVQRVIRVEQNRVCIKYTATVLGKPGVKQSNHMSISIPEETFVEAGASCMVLRNGKPTEVALPAEQKPQILAWFVDRLTWSRDGVTFRLDMDQPTAGANTQWPSLMKWALRDRRAQKYAEPHVSLCFGSVDLEAGDVMEFGCEISARDEETQ